MASPAYRGGCRRRHGRSTCSRAGHEAGSQHALLECSPGGSSQPREHAARASPSRARSPVPSCSLRADRWSGRSPDWWSGIAADYFINEAQEEFNRDKFVASNREALDATIDTDGNQSSRRTCIPQLIAGSTMRARVSFSPRADYRALLVSRDLQALDLGAKRADLFKNLVKLGLGFGPAFPPLPRPRAGFAWHRR